MNEGFGSYADYPFKLDDKEWPTVEHYFQAMKFEDEALQEKIRQADSAEKARKMGRSRLRKKQIRSDWKNIRQVIMTRAVYTRCRTYSHLTQQILDTGDNKLVENNSYDYFWGCGRDRRGENRYGQVLMNVRKKLKEESH